MTEKDRLGTEPVGRLMLRMATPSVFAMIMQALYSTVDSMFVGRISATSLVAITLAFPVTMFSGAISTGIGVGINSSISRNLGAGCPDKSSKAAVNGMAIGLLSAGKKILPYNDIYNFKAGGHSYTSLSYSIQRIRTDRCLGRICSD